MNPFPTAPATASLSAFRQALVESRRLVAILRGVRPDEVLAVVEALATEGIRIVEVPLNSPEPLRSIETVARAYGNEVTVGAGTVLDGAGVEAVARAGGRIVVAPNCDPRVIGRALELGLVPLPGVATPTEAFAAVAAGACLLKMFPAECLGPAALKAWRSVLPPEVALIPVGGIVPGNLVGFHAAGAAAFGVGSALYAPGDAPATVAARARAFMAAVEGLPD